jgi:hypothetical protein
MLLFTYLLLGELGIIFRMFFKSLFNEFLLIIDKILRLKKCKIQDIIKNTTSFYKIKKKKIKK